MLIELFRENPWGAALLIISMLGLGLAVGYWIGMTSTSARQRTERFQMVMISGLITIVLSLIFNALKGLVQ